MVVTAVAVAAVLAVTAAAVVAEDCWCWLNCSELAV